MTICAHQDQFRGFATYNAWFNDKIYKLVGELSDVDRKRDQKAFFGSIHKTLNHILLADRIWLSRFSQCHKFSSLKGADLIVHFDSLAQELYEDFTELANQRKATDQVFSNWVEELTPEVLSSTMKYKNSKGVERKHPLWLAAAHLFNHQTHHRGQITTLLYQQGKDPGVTDFIAIADQW